MNQDVTDFRHRRYGKRAPARIQMAFRITKEKRLQLERLAIRMEMNLTEIFDEALDALEEKLTEPLLEVTPNRNPAPVSSFKENTTTKTVGHNSWQRSKSVKV